MKRPQGYAVIYDPDKGTTEYDTYHCGHCQRVMHIQRSTQLDALGGFCRGCMRHICKPCLEPGTCLVFEKKLERYERAQRFAIGAGLVLR